MAAKEREEGGGSGGDYISTSTLRSRKSTHRLNQRMTWICQRINGGKEENTGKYG